MSQKSLCKGSGLLLDLWSSDLQNFFGNVPEKVAHSRKFNGFSEIDVHFFEWTFIFHVFRPLKHAWITSPLSYFCLAQRDTRSLKKIRALACPLFEISTVKVYVHDVGLCTASTISQAQTTTLDRVAWLANEVAPLSSGITCLWNGAGCA